MPLYDVSVPLCATTPTYPGDPGIEITEWLAIARGDPANVTAIRFGVHTGTHYDQPVDSYVDVPSSPALQVGRSFTITAWIAPTCSGVRPPRVCLIKASTTTSG